MARRTFIVVLSAVTVASAANTFVTLGDWGGSALDNPQYAINTQTVAAAMATTVENSAARTDMGRRVSCGSTRCANSSPSARMAGFG